VLNHNHYLAGPNKRQNLRSQRSVEEADKKLIGQMRDGGMKPAQVFEFMVQFYGGVDKVPFSRMDCNNEIGRQRKKYLEVNDAHTLMEYLKNKQIEDPSFFYAIEIDKDDGTMTNFFWAKFMKWIGCASSCNRTNDHQWARQLCRQRSMTEDDRGHGSGE
jgi:hypothetical protein